MNGDEARAYQYIVVAGKSAVEAQPVHLPEKAVMEHARLVAEQARLNAEVAHLRGRIGRIERQPLYRIAKTARDLLRGRRRA
jgi:hypothetical protein